MADNLKNTTTCTSACACRGGINRRDLLRLTGAGAIAPGTSRLVGDGRAV